MATTPLFVGLEGNIGVGKSTLLCALRDHFGDRVALVDEPVDLWQRHGLLAAMYDGSLGASAFQHCALMTRLGALARAVRSGATVVVGERSPFTDAIFARLTLQGVDHDAYEVTHREVMDALPPMRTAFVRLCCDVARLEARVRQRGRACESGVDRAYLERIDRAHEEWSRGSAPGVVVDVDANGDPREVTQRAIAAIETFIATSA